MEVKKFHTVFLLIATVLVMSATGKIRLVNNGYEGIVVSVDWAVEENLDLFKKLEGILTRASSVLFRATHNRTYFREFIFVVPTEWQTTERYDNALDVQVERADVIIDAPNAAAGDTPYTLRTGGCGTEGQYIHLTPDYILNNEVQKRFGPPGKTFVHEWGHLRWGLFDEYATEKKEEFYRFQDKWHPTRCSEEIDGVLKNPTINKYCQFDINTGLPEKNCKFVPFKNSKAVSSMMSHQFLDNIVEFCDDALTAPKHLRHNLLAPNIHNRLCEYQSAWEVMRQHADFKDRQNSAPKPNQTIPTPRFRYVQERPKKRVLVLDTSGSMSGKPLEFLRQAASNFILSSAEEKSQLGIVRFSSAAAVLSELQVIDSPATRARLVGNLPTGATGGTSIGSGLIQGLQVLTRDGQSSDGSLILITDGSENEDPRISDVLPTLIEKGVVVHAFAYGQAADWRLRQLAKDTGGKAFFYSGTKTSTSLIDGFASLTATANGLSNKNASVSILTHAITTTANVPWNGTFYIDSTIGRDTTLTFSYSMPISVAIESPDGFNKSQEVTNHRNIKVLSVALKGDVTPGLWTYRVSSAFSSDVKINIESKPRHSDGEVLQISSWVSQQDDVTFSASMTLDLYAKVVRGRTPVLGATVVANVERSAYETFSLPLRDDGIGSDIFKGDGIYSSSIIARDLTNDGRYSVKINVNGAKQNTTIIVGNQGLGNGASGGDGGGTDEGVRTKPLEDFQRVTTAGEFRINGFHRITEDKLAPARIMDFTVKSYDFDAMEATLEWTAVGGDMDRGQAARYIMYISNDQTTMLAAGNAAQSAARIPGRNVLRGDLNSSAPAGKREEFVVRIENTQEAGHDTNAKKTSTFYLSVSAVDEAGNEGQPSNVVTLSRAAELSVSREVEKTADSNSANLVIGLSVACGALIIIIIVSVLVRIRIKKRSKVSSGGKTPA